MMQVAFPVRTATAAAVIGCMMVVAAAGADSVRVIDPALTAKNAFVNARTAAMAGAGCALLDGAAAADVNPALPNAYAKYRGGLRLTAAAGYGRDSLFRFSLPGALVVCLGEYGSVGAFARWLKHDDTHYQYEGAATWSGRLFEKSMTQGAVDLGVNVRYERTWWEDSLHTVRYLRPHWDADTHVVYDTLAAPPPQPLGRWREDRLLLDVGFYQKEIAEHVDFALVCHNLLGYRWNLNLPGLAYVPAEADSLDAAHILKRDTLLFKDRTESNNWLSGAYRRVTVGIAFSAPIGHDQAVLAVPADVDFMGLFESGVKMRLAVRIGAELKFMEYFYIRGGYAYAPTVMSIADMYDGGRRPHRHLLRAGAGFRMKNVMVDFYMARNEWGATAGTAF
jgi:hypothetical protein